MRNNFNNFANFVQSVDLTGYTWYAKPWGDIVTLNVGLGNDQYLEINFMGKLIRCQKAHIIENMQGPDESIIDETEEFEFIHEAVLWIERMM